MPVVFRSILSIVALVSVTSGCGGPKVQMTLNLSPGETMALGYSLNESASYKLSGTTLDYSATFDVRLKIRVRSASTDTLDLDVTIDAYNVSQVEDANGVPIDVFQNAQGQSLSQVVGNAAEGKSFSALLGPDGRVHSFSGTEEIRKHIRDSVPVEQFKLARNATPSQLEEVRKGLTDRFSDSALGALLEICTATQPDEPVGRGSTWKSIFSPAPFTDSAMESTFTCTQVLDTFILVEVSGVSRPASGSSGAGPSGTLSGTGQFDLNSGLLTQIHFNVKETGETGNNQVTDYDGTTSYKHEVVKY